MSNNKSQSSFDRKYKKEIDDIKTIKANFHDDIKNWNNIIWRKQFETMNNENLDAEKRRTLDYQKGKLDELGECLEFELNEMEETINRLLNYLAQKAEFDISVDKVENLGFKEECIQNRPIATAIPIEAQHYIFHLLELIIDVILDLTELYKEFSVVQELFDDIKGLYELKRKVSEMSMDYFRLRDHFESGKKEIMNKNDAIMNMHTNLIFNKMNEDKAKYCHRKLSRQICVTQIQKAFTTYNKSYYGTMKKIKKSDSYLRDMLSGWNTYLRKDKTNGESHKPLHGYEEKVFESEEVFYNWALDTLVPHFYEEAEKREANIKERDNRNNIENDTRYEESKRRGKRKISGSHEPLNTALSILDNDEYDEDRGEDEQRHYFDEPESPDVKHMAEILKKKLNFSGSLEDFCKKYEYRMKDVLYSIEQASDHLIRLLNYKG